MNLGDDQRRFATADVSAASADHFMVFVSTYMALLLAVLQIILMAGSVAAGLVGLMLILPIVALVTGGLSLLSTSTRAKLRLALIAHVSAIPGALLLICIFVHTLFAGSDLSSRLGFVSRETLRSIVNAGLIEALLATFIWGVPLVGVVLFFPAHWRLIRQAYPPATSQLLRSAWRTQMSPPRQYTRFSLWLLPLLLSVLPLLAASLLAHLVVRPFGGFFHNRLTMSPQYPLGWIKAFARFYKRKSQLRATQALERDSRAPILMLRSFADDGVSYAPPEILESAPRFASLETLRFQLEENLARELCRKGPPIAIGAPGEQLPPVGAYRQYCSEAEWQGVVLSRMAQAQAVVVIASQTKWLSWELDQIVSKNHIGKCMIFFPPLAPAAHADRVDAVLQALSPVLPPDASILAPGLVALLFRPNGSVTAVVDRKQTKQSYVLAAQAGLSP